MARMLKLTFFGAIVCFYAAATGLPGPRQAPSDSKKAAQSPPHDEGWVRDVDPNAACTFAPVFQRISDNKQDPRVAFVELSRFVHVDNPMKFENLCEMISDQTSDTNAVFDKARGYLQIVWGSGEMSEALAYFGGAGRTPGVFLYTQTEGVHAMVFAYREQEWRDVTKEYLGDFHLGQDDFVVAPQYGRTARVLSFAADTHELRHKFWLRWDGVRFLEEKVRPKDWRCPDGFRHYPARERREYCE